MASSGNGCGHKSGSGGRAAVSGSGERWCENSSRAEWAERAAIVARVETLLWSSRLLAQELAASRTHAAHLLQAVLKAAFTPAA